MAENDLNAFCRQVRARSAEHREAIKQLRSVPSQMFSVLRQELDSLVRVIYVLSQHDREFRRLLLHASVSGKKWTHYGSRRPVTDREMVDLANNLHGWTKSVYMFGCSFIHLSNMHDYGTRDPLALIPEEEKVAIISHLRYYHGGPTQERPTFNDIVPLLPNVLDKITGNLECYVEDLENDEDIDSI